MRILVTGATGFIGSHLTHRLVCEGHDVGIIKRRTSDTWRIDDMYPRITVFDADLPDLDSVFDAVMSFKPDIVYHLATYYVVEHKPTDINPLYNTNALGLINLLDASKAAGVKLFVNTSTSFVGALNNSPGFFNPVNLYAVTKLQSEQACDYYSKHGLECVTFRLFPPYGEKDNVRKFIPSVINSALDRKTTELKTSLGFQKWDYTYVGDIVNAYLSLIPLVGTFKLHEVFDIGTGEAHTLRTVVNVILNMLNSPITPVWGALPYRDNEVFYTCADTSVADKKLHWKAETTLYKGINKTIEWYKEWNRIERLNYGRD